MNVPRFEHRFSFIEFTFYWMNLIFTSTCHVHFQCHSLDRGHTNIFSSTNPTNSIALHCWVSQIPTSFICYMWGRTNVIWKQSVPYCQYLIQNTGLPPNSPNDNHCAVGPPITCKDMEFCGLCPPQPQPLFHKWVLPPSLDYFLLKQSLVTAKACASAMGSSRNLSYNEMHELLYSQDS